MLQLITSRDMLKYGLSLIRILPYMDRIVCSRIYLLIYLIRYLSSIKRIVLRLIYNQKSDKMKILNFNI